MGKEKRLNIKCAELCKVLSPTTSFNQIEKKHREITAQGILIANVQDLKILSHYKALDSMMEKGFFDSHREKEVNKILEKMYKESDAKQNQKRQ